MGTDGALVAPAVFKTVSVRLAADGWVRFPDVPANFDFYVLPVPASALLPEHARPQGDDHILHLTAPNLRTTCHKTPS